MPTRRMAYPPPSSICHYFGFGFGPIVQGSIFGWSLFFPKRFGPCLRRAHGSVSAFAFVPTPLPADTRFQEIAAHLLPGTRLLRSAACAAGPKAPPLPSGGAFLFASPRSRPPIPAMGQEVA